MVVGRPAAVATSVATVATVAVLVLLAVAGCTSSQPDVAVTVPTGAVATGCFRLHEALPDTVGGRHRRSTSPASARTAAWGDTRSVVVLRCGVDRPPSLRDDSVLIDLGSPPGAHGGSKSVSWLLTERAHTRVFTSVGLSAYVEVAVPTSVARERATAPLVDLATVLRQTMH